MVEMRCYEVMRDDEGYLWVAGTWYKWYPNLERYIYEEDPDLRAELHKQLEKERSYGLCY